MTGLRGTLALLVVMATLAATGIAQAQPGAEVTVDELVVKLNSAEYGKYCIRIDGHTDDQPVVKSVKENHDNWELGFKRAKAVLDYMIAKGVSQERCFIASWNCFRPMVPTIAATLPMPPKHSKRSPVVESRQKRRRPT